MNRVFESVSRFFRVEVLIAVWAAVIAAIFISIVAGCSDSQWASIARGAQAVEFVTFSNPTHPTTSPSDSLSAARDIASAAKAVPAISDVLAIVGAISSLIAGIAGGHFAGRQKGASVLKHTAKKLVAAQGAIIEIVDDVAEFKNPGGAWTEKTAELLIDLGKVAEASIDASNA